MAGANEGLGATNEGGSLEPYAADVTSYGRSIQIYVNTKVGLVCS